MHTLSQRSAETAAGDGSGGPIFLPIPPHFLARSKVGGVRDQVSGLAASQSFSRRSASSLDTSSTLVMIAQRCPNGSMTVP